MLRIDLFDFYESLIKAYKIEKEQSEEGLENLHLLKLISFFEIDHDEEIWNDLEEFEEVLEIIDFNE